MKLCRFDLADTQFNFISPSVVQDISLLLEHGVQCGGFLEAVLDNDLRTAVARADSRNAHDLALIVRLLISHVPGVFGHAGSVAKYVSGRTRYIINEHGQAERLEVAA